MQSTMTVPRHEGATAPVSVIASPIALEIIAHALNGPIPLSRVIADTGRHLDEVVEACGRLVQAGAITETEDGQLISTLQQLITLLPYSRVSA